MDALIPILLTIGFFIFQAYVGYKKEQEKAAKRNPGRPNTMPAPSKTEHPKKRDWLEELLQPQSQSEKPVYQPEKTYIEPVKQAEQKYVEPHYETFYKPEKYVPAEKPASLLAEYRSLSTYDEDEVLKKARTLRNDKRSAIKRLETKALQEQDIEREKNLIHFDLQEAIIINAILERPYK